MHGKHLSRWYLSCRAGGTGLGRSNLTGASAGGFDFGAGAGAGFVFGGGAGAAGAGASGAGAGRSSAGAGREGGFATGMPPYVMLSGSRSWTSCNRRSSSWLRVRTRCSSASSRAVLLGRPWQHHIAKVPVHRDDTSYNRAARPVAAAVPRRVSAAAARRR